LCYSCTSSLLLCRICNGHNRPTKIELLNDDDDDDDGTIELTAEKCLQLGHLRNFKKATENSPFFTASCDTFLPPSVSAFLIMALYKLLQFIHSFTLVLILLEPLIARLPDIACALGHQGCERRAQTED